MWGLGEQTVLVESGGGGWSLDWFLVLDGLSSFSKVCVYDRAGFGWSDTAEGGRDFQTLVSELDRLLVNSGTGEPLIVVGASLGGAIVQMYAQQFPDKVAALLLLDARAKGSVTDMLAIEPLIVVTQGYENRLDSLELSEIQRVAIKRECARQQYELSTLSNKSGIVVAENSGHFIQLDQPELVVELVKELVEKIEEAEIEL